MNVISDVPSNAELRLGKGVQGLYIDGTPELITGEISGWATQAGVEAVRLPGYWIHKKGEKIIMGEKPSAKEKVVYFLHGGAYVHLSAHPKSPTSNIPRGFLKHVSSVRRTFALEYRLSSITQNPPRNPFPCALIDAVAGYAYLTNQVGYDPANIIVVGDSAGGNLAQALVRYLVEHAGSVPGLPPPPGALIMCSPWSDMSGSHTAPGSSVFKNAKSDYIIIPTEPFYIDAPRSFIHPFGLSFPASTPYVSPACKKLDGVSFKGFPPTFITSGDAEVLLDQIRTLQQRMKSDLGEEGLMYYEAKDAFHDYLCFPWAEPERTATFTSIARWVASLP